MTDIRNMLLGLYELNATNAAAARDLIPTIPEDVREQMRVMIHQTCIRCQHPMDKHYAFYRNKFGPYCQDPCSCREFAEDNLKLVEQEAKKRSL